MTMMRRNRRDGRDFGRISSGWSLTSRLGPDVPRVIVKGPSDDGAFIGEPGVEDWTFSVSVLAFQLADVEVDLLGCR